MIHRGPDGSGEDISSHVALLMRRLSIIDVAGGQQPLYNEDSSIAVVANGEIYNSPELRSMLIGKRHQFRTGSDCETIVHLYEEYGLDFVHHLRGMFAIALWDSRLRRLVLARDRMGEKPLYLYQTKNQLLFASEMKTLLQTGLVPFELDPAGVDQYFHFEYVPEPGTAVKNVRKLDAGHILTVDVDDWRVTEQCYWNMEDAEPLDGDPVELLAEELERVAELVIRSDVPVGVAVSGGLDSSLIAAIASRKYPGNMQAFSVGYAGRPRSDERNAAESLARRLGMPFFDVALETSAMVEQFPDLIRMTDDPFTDIASFGYLSVSRLAREHNVPVLLQGQGGDELFWGVDATAKAADYLAAGARWTDPVYARVAALPEGAVRVAKTTKPVKRRPGR